jgi:predicted phage terminase large subunit-like protein
MKPMKNSNAKSPMTPSSASKPTGALIPPPTPPTRPTCPTNPTRPTRLTRPTLLPDPLRPRDPLVIASDKFIYQREQLPPDLRIPITRQQCQADLVSFARLFFPNACRLDWSPLHVHLFRRRLAKTSRPLADRRGVLDVVLAPRGSAKSTLVSLFFPVHALLYGIENYIVLISATMRQATRRLANIKSALLQNDQFRLNFPELFKKPFPASIRSIELAGGRIDAFSAGTELRGISHGPWRPTWIILDDAERSERCRISAHRDALADWFSEVIENLGEPCTNIDVIGTLLHHDALPARLLQRPDVTGRTFTSILAESSRQDLWDAWRALFHNLEDPNRLATARCYFKDNAAKMTADAEVLWLERESYYDLQVMRETRGRTAFDKEKQNAPLVEGAGIFIIYRLRRFVLEGERIIRDPLPGVAGDEATPPERRLDDLRVFGFLDPALGAANGDFAAIATVGLDPVGYLHVLEVWMARVAPAAQIEQVFKLHARWRYENFGIETNAFQRLLLEPLEAERRRRRGRGEPWDLPIEERHHHGDKAGRILTLEPLAHNGWLLFNRELDAEFMRQLEDFPAGRHDDGPDAVAAAVALARLAQQKLERLKRRPRPGGASMGNF